MNHSPLDTTIPSSFRSAPFGTVRWSWPSWWDWCGCTRWPSRSTSPWSDKLGLAWITVTAAGSFSGAAIRNQGNQRYHLLSDQTISHNAIYQPYSSSNKLSPNKHWISRLSATKKKEGGVRKPSVDFRFRASLGCKNSS